MIPLDSTSAAELLSKRRVQRFASEGELRKPKKPARRREPPGWEVLRLKASPAASMAIVDADDAESAIAAGKVRSEAAHCPAALMPDFRLPRGLQRLVARARTKSESADGLLRIARRYADTEVVRAIGAVLAVVAVVILAGLAWLWLFGG
jgi:hypothetical protein